VTPREARRLKVGDRVAWQADPIVGGTVIDKGYIGLTIKWDDGQTDTLHIYDCENVLEVGK